MRVMALFPSSFFAKCLRVGEDGPGWGHLCHTDTFLVYLKVTVLHRSCLSSFLFFFILKIEFAFHYLLNWILKPI